MFPVYLNAYTSISMRVRARNSNKILAYITCIMIYIHASDGPYILYYRKYNVKYRSTSNIQSLMCYDLFHVLPEHECIMDHSPALSNLLDYLVSLISLLFGIIHLDLWFLDYSQFIVLCNVSIKRCLKVSHNEHT